MAQAARKVAPDAPALTAEQVAILKEVGDKPEIVLTDETKFGTFLEALKRQIELDPGTVDTEKGRDKIRSNARSVSTRKTPIEAARKKLTEDWRAKTTAVNAVGKYISETMDALRDEVRAPLTAYEEAEEKRKSEAQAIIDDMRAAAVVAADATIEAVRATLDRIRGININDEMFGVRTEMVVDLRDNTVRALQEAIARIEKADADRLELEQLREREATRAREEEERQRAEREKQDAADRAERERTEREAREKAETERVERERRDAAESAQREAEAKARREQEEKDAAAQAEIDAANEKARLAQQEAYERKLIQHIMDCGNGTIGGAPYAYVILLRELDEKVDLGAFEVLGDEARDAHGKARAKIVEGMERQQAKEAEEAEQRRKEADRAHRSKIQREAKESIMGCGVSEEAAKLIVVAIAAGNIPHVSIRF